MQEKIEKRTNLGPILIGTFLLNLCHSYVDSKIIIFRQKHFLGINVVVEKPMVGLAMFRNNILQ